MNMNRCDLCGKRNGYKTKCSEGRCHAYGEKNKPYHFHATCARQVGFEVAHRDEEDDFVVHCYVHSSNEHNLRARLEDLIETEKKRAGKDFSRADHPMKFSDGSKLLNGAILVMRILGWAWRWAEWWVEFGSTWEPLLEPGQEESEMTAKELRIVESSKESRKQDARQCRLAAFGAALRNRSYDTEDGFNTEALERALRAILHTRSLVGPLNEYEIEFFVDGLARAYRSKSRLLGFGEDKIPVANDDFCLHLDDKSPKYELGSRSLPGQNALAPGMVFEDNVSEPDDFLKSSKTENGEEIDLSLFPEIDYKYKGDLSDESSDEDSDEEDSELEAIIDTSLLDKENGYLLTTRRGRIPKFMTLSIVIKYDGDGVSDGFTQDDESLHKRKKPKARDDTEDKQFNKPSQPYKVAEADMNFDKEGFGPLQSGKTEFLISIGMKSVDEFMKTVTKEITLAYSEWRKSKKMGPLKDLASAGNILNKWKSDVRKHYKQFIGKDESIPGEQVSNAVAEEERSDETASAGPSKRSRDEMDGEVVERASSSKRSRKESGNEDAVVESNAQTENKTDSDSKLNDASRKRKLTLSDKVQEGKVETSETRSSPRKSVVYREGMFAEKDVEDDLTDTEGDRESDTADSEIETKKRKVGRPKNLLNTLSKGAMEFLKSIGIKSDREFLSCNTKELGLKYAKYREKTGQAVLKSTGAAAKISSWKRVVRDAAVADGNADLAEVKVDKKKVIGDPEEESDAEESDDDKCEICGEGGDLLICDGCEKTYHTKCVNLSEIPKGDWFCPTCQSKDDDAADDDECEICGDGGDLLICDGCEKSYHPQCVDLKEIPEGDWFCPKCKK